MRNIEKSPENCIGCVFKKVEKCNRINRPITRINQCTTGRLISLPDAAQGVPELIRTVERVWRAEGENERKRAGQLQQV